jgi:large subunit ribosomal protein L20
MVRVKRGNVAAKRRKKYLKLADGYRGGNSRLSSLATEQVIQSLNFAYIGRKLKKRNYRTIWIGRINAALRLKKMSYSTFIGSLKKADILLNRKVLSYLAFSDLSVLNLIQRSLL